MSTSICLYYPGNPWALFQFLDSTLRAEILHQWKVQGNHNEMKMEDMDKIHSIVLNPEIAKNYEILLWVDNDDHKVSSEFYTLRKYIRKGLNVQVFVNPALGNPDLVFEELKAKASGDQVFENNSYRTDIRDVVLSIAVFEEEQDVVINEKA